MTSSRREFLASAAAAGLIPQLLPAQDPAPKAAPAGGPIAVSSGNGLQACKKAVERMQAGDRPVEAAVKGVNLVEDDPEDDSVGYGGLPNEEGVVELDSCVMDGPTHLAGAVASLRGIKNPSSVALLVLRRTDHVLLVGEGALRFARAHGFKEENLLTEASRQKWLAWKSRHSKTDDWLEENENDIPEPKRQTGTINMLCLNANGDLGGCTSTSGLAWKIPGRVGDSPLIGCGLYVDNDVGAAGSTGRGEACILVNGGASVVEQMRQGKHPKDATLEVCKRVVHLTRIKRLRRADGKPDFNVTFYALNKKGEFGACSLYPSSFTLAGPDGPRKLDTGFLFPDGK
jgi:N4-(beta-N-acetylglucosaminyl)-L-asparaginase